MTLYRTSARFSMMIIQSLLIATLWSLSLAAQAIGHDRERLEIEFREQPDKLYNELIKATEFPLSFNGPQEFSLIADDLGFSPEELHRDLEVLARLNLEHNVNSETKIPDVKLLITQLSSIAASPLEEAVVLMLKARLTARDKQDYQGAINLYNESLSKIADEQDMAAILFKYTLHDHLNSLHYMLRQAVPSLSHLNRYRAIAYQLRNDYFIAQAESAMGFYYNRQKELAKSLQHYSEAFSLANRLPYPGIKAQAQFQLARTYRDLEQWSDALKHAHQAVASFQHLDQKAAVSQALTVIAMIYAAQEEWNKAIDYYLNAQQIDEKIGNQIGEALSFNNIGEAYENLGNSASAIKYLQLANAIFREKNTAHYLVYNELLFAKVSLGNSDWEATKYHGNQALTIARDKQLIEEQIEALAYLTKAYRQLGEQTSAINVLEEQLTLSGKTQEANHDDAGNVALTEQKLKFELSLLQSKNSQYIEDKQQTHLILFSLMLIIALLVPAFIISLKHIKKLISKLEKYRHKLSLEPVTALKGYKALLSHLRLQQKARLQEINQHDSQLQGSQTLVLARIDNLLNCDVGLGLTQSNQLISQYFAYFEKHMQAEVFVIRPEIFAFYFDAHITVQDVAMQLKQCLTELNLDNRIHLGFPQQLGRENHYVLGHINLPLHANPDVKITAELEFETAQFALGAAMSTNKQDSYVSLRTLNFAPAAIFFKPLYLNLTQAVQRGMVRVDTDQEQTDIFWPKH
jgi:tetratricopeptide (TPR) repeat protein